MAPPAADEKAAAAVAAVATGTAGGSAPGGGTGSGRSTPAVATSNAMIDNLRRKAAAVRGHVTRRRRETEQAIQAAISHPCLENSEVARRRLIAYEEKFNLLEEAYDDLLLSDASELREEYTSKCNSEFEMLEQIRQSVAASIACRPPPPQPRDSTPRPTTTSIGPTGGKVDTSIAPAILRHDNTYPEFKVWVRNLRHFFEQNRLSAQHCGVQQAHVIKYVDSQLNIALNPFLFENTPVFGPDDSVLSILEAEFKRLYPLDARRVEFFHNQRASGEDPSQYMKRLVTLAHDADLANCSFWELVVFKTITSVALPKLQDELLKNQDKSFEAVRDQIAYWVSAANTKKTISSFTPTSSSAVLQTKGGHRGRSPQRSKSPRGQQKGMCNGCGGSHKHQDCVAYKKKIKCNNCGKIGHFAKVCKQPERSPSASTRTVTPGPSTPFPGTASSSTMDLSDISHSLPEIHHDQYSSFGRDSPINISMIRNVSTTRETPRLRLAAKTEEGKKFIISGVPDTGAARSLISLAFANRHGITVSRSREQLRTANGAPLNVAGAAVIEVSTGTTSIFMDVIVSRDLIDDALIGWQHLQALRVIPQDFPRAISNVRAHIPMGSRVANDMTPQDVQDRLSALQDEFSDVVCDTLSPANVASGEPAVIMLRDENVIPTQVRTSRPVPVHWEEEGKRMIDGLLASGRISRVDGPADWVAPAHFVAKPNGKLRLVTDYRGLNRHVRRPVHPFPSAQDIVRGINPESKVFAKMDAVMGYFQIPLTPEAAKMTTFLLPWGKFQYNFAPMGLNLSGDLWNVKSDKLIADVPNTLKIVDDIITGAPNYDILFHQLRAILTACRTHGIVLSKQKFAIGPRLDFAGFSIGQSGIRPDNKKIEALTNFPRPQNITDLRSFLGLANQLGMFMPDLAQITAPMRVLLKKNNAFRWTEDIEMSFRKSITALTAGTTIHPFDRKMKTLLLTDASRVGLGFMLLQKDEEDVRLIQCGSFALSPAEKNYAIIELELLAVVRAVQKCRHYLLGIESFTVITDHKPLIGLFQKDLQDVINPRLERMLEDLRPMPFSATWNAGKTHYIADALSRAPIWPPASSTDPAPIFRAEVYEDPLIQTLEKASCNDPEYDQLRDFIKGKCQIPSLYKSAAHELSCLSSSPSSIVLMGTRIVVPSQARPRITAGLHASHQGLSKTLKQASLLYFWPGMSSDIKNAIGSCRECQSTRQRNPPEPLIHTQPRFPMDIFGVDLCYYGGHQYMVGVDAFSGYILVHRLHSTSTFAVTSTLRSWFQTFGFPITIRSDNGPQFRTEFGEFCKANNIMHKPSSPYFPQSNGLAESAVKSAKTLMKRTSSSTEFETALSHWMNVPRRSRASPNELFLGRPTRTTLPIIFNPHPDAANVQSSFNTQRDAPTAHPLRPLSVGEHVFVRDDSGWTSSGIIIGSSPSKRSYMVDVDGDIIRRNRRFLRPSTPINRAAPKRVRFQLHPADNGEPRVPHRTGNPTDKHSHRLSHH